MPIGMQAARQARYTTLNAREQSCNERHQGGRTTATSAIKGYFGGCSAIRGIFILT